MQTQRAARKELTVEVMQEAIKRAIREFTPGMMRRIRLPRGEFLYIQSWQGRFMITNCHDTGTIFETACLHDLVHGAQVALDYQMRWREMTSR